MLQNHAARPAALFRSLWTRVGGAVLFLTALWLLFFWRLLAPSIDRVVIEDTDFTQHYYAFASYQAERLWQGEFPLWNPYNHGGDPFAGNIQFSAFYPPRLLGVLLLGADGYSLEDYELEVALHVWLASVLMLAFIGVVTGRWSVGLVGSVLYAYSGYLTGYPLTQVSILESAVWLPLILLGVQLACTRPAWTLAGSALGGIGIALSLLGGHPQTTLYLVYLAVAYLIYRGWQQRLSFVGVIGRLLILGAVGGGLSAIQLLPSLEFTRLSARVTAYGYADKANGFTPVEWLNVLIPGAFAVLSPLYIGIAGLMLAALGSLRSQQRSFWVGVMIVGLFVALGSGSIAYDLIYLLVPGGNVFRQQERVAVLVSFALVMLAVEGLCWWLAASPATRGRVLRFAGVLVGILSALALVMALTQTSNADRAAQSASVFVLVAVYALLMAGWLAWQAPSPVVAIGALLALIVLDLFSVGTRLPFYQPDTAEHRPRLSAVLNDFSTAPADIRWRVDGAAGLAGNGVLFRVPDIYGTGPFTLGTVEALRTLPVDRFWEVLAVRYVTTLDEPPASVPLELRAYDRNLQGEEFRLFELTDPRPLAWLVYDARSAEGNPVFARQLMADSRVNLREMAITLLPLTTELPVTRPAISRVDDFTLASPERWTMRLSTETNALLTLSLVDYPGWRATVNGQPAPVVEINGGLIGIPVSAGMDQQVVVEYAPSSVLTGLLITALSSIVTLALLLIWPLRRWRQRLGVQSVSG